MSKSIQERLQEGNLPDERGESTTHLWLVSYSDFMTILMIFFMVLFAFRLWVKKSSWDSERERMARMTEEAQKGMVQRLARMATVEVQTQRINIHLSDALLFEPGRSDLKTSAVELLSRVSPELAGFNGEIIVEGHTDNQPLGSHARYRSNWELSVARAFSVIRCLTSHGVDPQHIAARGYGPYRPRVANDTPDHRAENRRIEIILLNPVNGAAPSIGLPR